MAKPVIKKSGDGEDWLATYADAITLLMAFFVMIMTKKAIRRVIASAYVASQSSPSPLFFMTGFAIVVSILRSYLSVLVDIKMNLWI